jgi:hypothetical protein
LKENHNADYTRYFYCNSPRRAPQTEPRGRGSTSCLQLGPPIISILLQIRGLDAYLKLTMYALELTKATYYPLVFVAEEFGWEAHDAWVSIVGRYLMINLDAVHTCDVGSGTRFQKAYTLRYRDGIAGPPER